MSPDDLARWRESAIMITIAICTIIVGAAIVLDKSAGIGERLAAIGEALGLS